MLLLIFALVSRAFVAEPSNAAADCFLPGGLRGALQAADVVIEGRVVTAGAANPEEGSGATVSTVRITVNRVWKGEVASAVTVRQHWTAEDIPLETGRRYLVFARYRSDGKLIVAPVCEGTRPWPISRAERDTLGAGRPPVARSGKRRG